MKKILKKFEIISYPASLISTSTFKQSSITFTGTVINAFFGALFYILAARFLGPAAFGLFSVAIATLTLISDIGDLGTNTGIVNFVPRFYKDNTQEANRYLKLGLEIKIVVWILVVIFGIYASPFIAQTIFDKPDLTEPLRIVFVGVGSMLLFSFVISTLQALQRFWLWSIIQVIANTLRLIIIIFLFVLGILTLRNTLWAYIALPFFGFIIGLYFVKTTFLKVENEWSISRNFFKYNTWVALFTLLAAFGGRIDTFLTARLMDATQIGIYAVANQLVKIVPQIVASLGTVIAPKMASMGNVKDFISYLKKTQVMVLLLAFLGIFSIPIVYWLIPILFGVEYISSGPIFMILLFAMLIFLISVPVHNAVFYYYSYPQLFVWLSLLHLILTIILGWNLISEFGIMGAALTVLIGQFLNFVVPLIWVLNKIRNQNK